MGREKAWELLRVEFGLGDSAGLQMKSWGQSAAEGGKESGIFMELKPSPVPMRLLLPPFQWLACLWPLSVSP